MTSTSDNRIHPFHKTLNIAEPTSVPWLASGHDRLCCACQRLRPNAELLLNICQNTPLCTFAPHEMPLVGLQRLLHGTHTITRQQACAPLACLDGMWRDS